MLDKQYMYFPNFLIRLALYLWLSLFLIINPLFFFEIKNSGNIILEYMIMIELRKNKVVSNDQITISLRRLTHGPRDLLAQLGITRQAGCHTSVWFQGREEVIVAVFKEMDDGFQNMIPLSKGQPKIKASLGKFTPSK